MVPICGNMGRHTKDAYLKALELLNQSEVARQTGRSYRVLTYYRRGERKVTERAARELVQYLRKRADELTAAAAALEVALAREADDGKA